MINNNLNMNNPLSFGLKKWTQIFSICFKATCWFSCILFLSRNFKPRSNSTQNRYVRNFVMQIVNQLSAESVERLANQELATSSLIRKETKCFIWSCSREFSRSGGKIRKLIYRLTSCCKFYDEYITVEEIFLCMKARIFGECIVLKTKTTPFVPVVK